MRSKRMCGRVYLNIRSNKDVVPNRYSLIVHESTIHSNYYVVTDKYVLAVITMNRHIHHNVFTDPSKKRFKYLSLLGGITVIARPIFAD